MWKVTDGVGGSLQPTNAVPGGAPLSSPVTPVRGFRIGLGGEDENTLRQRLRQRAMRVADGLPVDLDGGVLAGSDAPAPRPEAVHHASPAASGAFSRGGATVSGQRSPAGSGTTHGHRGDGSLQHMQEDAGDTALPCNEQTTQSYYMLNHLIRDNERSASPVQPVHNNDVGANGLGAQETPQQQTPPSCGRSSGARTDTPSPVPSGLQSGAGTTASQSGGGASTPPAPGSSSPPPNTKRWGDTETDWLCRFRNEVRTLMGEDTEVYGRARLKAGFWKIVEQRMREKGYNRRDEQCKNKFNPIMEYYRRLKAHEKSWYDIIDPGEKDKDSIDLSNLMDSGADEERFEDEDDAADHGSGAGGASGDPPAGVGGSTSGSQGAGIEPTLGKRKRGYVSARESSVQSVTIAMRAHTVALTRSDKECTVMRIEAMRAIATQQVEARRELVLQEIASRERIADRMGERVERGYSALVDVIRSLRSRRGSSRESPSSSDSR
ncbi:hypothetical protein CBR_g907 [Chara braunii]|uniref:Myb/SANT-like DNA-binding domain-containing protein n=1 Tax=Chara braunii TaxID=69332 RepID=A0A388KCI7_CHABU|nr:hypothetical protein CBR_g907 [Chara braunii]|eukprot:GBG67782.1 hypothetical protein CBR_g907 [Chara braunii]